MASIQSALNSLVRSTFAATAAMGYGLEKKRENERKAAARAAGLQEKAETASVKRLQQKAKTQAEMVKGISERFDLLSAKQKRQVLDVAHKLEKKVGAEDGK